jgi:hypothetical protein
LGWWNSQYGKIKNDPNHQPDIPQAWNFVMASFPYIAFWWWFCTILLGRICKRITPSTYPLVNMEVAMESRQIQRCNNLLHLLPWIMFIYFR